MAELIYKGMLKNCYAGDFRMDGKTPCMATYESIRKMIDIQPTTTEAEIRAKAIDEFAERLKELFKYESAWGKTEYHKRFVIDISKIDELAEEMRGVKNETN